MYQKGDACPNNRLHCRRALSMWTPSASRKMSTYVPRLIWTTQLSEMW
ncbi:hypothetical protein LINGRAHAP2_LOCUS9763, partial [Linum grandiflorum]